MKRRVKVLIDAEILRLAKQKAAETRRPLSDLIQQALMTYFGKQAGTPEERKTAYELFCKRPMKIPADQLRYVLDEDVSGC